MVADMKLVAALLDYPSPLTQQILNDLPNILPECHLLEQEGKNGILQFSKEFEAMNLLDWQKAYTDTFDIAPVTSLYLFEHVYGSSTKRGAAMSSLKETYREHGLEISNNELPDYLPCFLDFLSTFEDEEEMLSYLADISRLLASMHEALDKNHNPYASLIKSMHDLSLKGKAHE